MNTSEGITYQLLIRSALRYEVKINVPADETCYCINQAIHELGRDAEIPGFRKGRASPEGVRAHYGESRVREVAADILAHDAFSKIVGSLKNKPVTPPEFELPEFIPGDDRSRVPLDISFNADPEDLERVFEHLGCSV